MRDGLGPIVLDGPGRVMLLRGRGMAYPGLVIRNPIQRDAVEFLATGGSTAGARIEARVTVQPGGSVVEHVHPVIEERFQVTSGALVVRVHGVERELGPGDAAVIPPGAPHTWRNDGDEPARADTLVQPALAFDEYIETVYGLARDGVLLESGRLGNLLRLAPLMRGPYRDLSYLARSPIWLQKLGFAVLAPLARARGYPSEYPEYISRSPEGPAD